MESAANTISIVRDIALIVVLLLFTAIILTLYVKISKILKSFARILSMLGDISDTLGSKIVAPAAASSGLAFGAGKLAAFISGFSRKEKTRERGE